MKIMGLRFMHYGSK